MAVVGCSSGGANFHAVVSDAPLESSGQSGTLRLELHASEGEPFAGSGTVIVHVHRADLDCDVADPARFEPGTVVKVERDEDVFRVSEPPQTDAARVVCQD